MWRYDNGRVLDRREKDYKNFLIDWQWNDGFTRNTKRGLFKARKRCPGPNLGRDRWVVMGIEGRDVGSHKNAPRCETGRIFEEVG
jgi:hypothetical protein